MLMFQHHIHGLIRLNVTMNVMIMGRYKMTPIKGGPNQH